MKRFFCALITLTALIFLNGCNKEKRLMKDLVGNWDIESSEKVLHHSDGTQTVLESITGAGRLIIYEDPADKSGESLLYNFFYVNVDQDTLETTGKKLFSDERNYRIILQKAIRDSVYQSDIVWTIEKSRNKKQEWSTYGVDSVLFYPANNHNPGNAQNWVEWYITLKKK